MVMNKNKKISMNKNKKNFVKPAKVNSKMIKKVEKKIEIKEESNSEEDLSEEEMQKMLGTSDNSDIDSDEFSEQEEVEEKEAKVNRKRKISLSEDEDDEKLKKIKTISADDSQDLEEDDDDEEDDDEDEEDDDFIDDDDEEDEEEEESTEVQETKDVKTASIVKIEPKPKKEVIKKEIVAKTVEEIKKENLKKEAKDAKNALKKKVDKENAAEKQLVVKSMFEDTPKVESASLKKEINDRLNSRMKRTIVFNSLPLKFTITDAKKLVPDLVSCIIPYNSYLHKINGTSYIDLATPQEAISIAKKLNNSEYKSRKLFVMVQSKIIDDVDKYNCQRLVVSNVHPKATVDDVKRVLPKAVQVEMLPQKNIDRKVFRTAFAHYSSVEDAIVDYDTKHGVEIKECPINLKFQIRKSDNVKERSTFDKKRLNVFGLKKNTSLDELKKTFPQAVSIKPALDKGVATIIYNNEQECQIDRAKAIETVNGKWRINLAISNGSENKLEKKTAGKFENKRNEENKLENRKSQGKKFENRKSEGKNFENRKSGGKNFENRKSGGKKFEGQRPNGDKFKKENVQNFNDVAPIANINGSVLKGSIQEIDRALKRKQKKERRKVNRQMKSSNKVKRESCIKPNV